MAHQRHLEKTKYRQWVKAGLGLTYLREGIAPFCDDIAKLQHKDILDNIKQTKSLSAVACGQCSWMTLRPDHSKGGNRSCTLGQRNCNCCNPAGKIICPNEVCGAIYDAIVTSDNFSPHAPYWKNTETQHWCTDPWSIAKCFINGPGYDKKASAADIDCIGLLHLIRNNQYFHNHVQCTITQTDVFSKVIADRHEIFHSSTMELEETEANSYIDDMIAVLQDGKELNNRQDAKDAVKKLEEEMKRLKVDVSSQQEPPDYEQSKLELQTRLIEFYRGDILRMSALPQQQESNLCDFKDVYVRTRMVIESKDDLNNEPKLEDVRSMSDIFAKDGKPMKSIYVLGEAGSGKSCFCKSLVNYWCLAHSDGQNIEDEFSGVREMKKFNFVFLLPLRHYTDKMKIKEMLEEKYEHPALKKLLECESRTCLVVLDGLDEWAPPGSKCPPERGALKEYTVLTTSRPWKIATLGISDNEIRQKISLKGFDDETTVKNMIEKTVPILNKIFKKDKDSSDCERALENKSVASLKHTAITLKQLICLWYDDKLHGGTSRCALYTEMLDLFFDWQKRKHPDDPRFIEMMKKSESLQNVKLPLYLRHTEVCKSYSYIIHDVSRLAYETLFNNMKETSLSFDSSTFERLKISNEVKTCCLKLGILSENKCSSLSASRNRRSIIAFVHKTFQEYLAAIYIAIKFNAHIVSSADSGNDDLSDKCAAFFQRVFYKCNSLNDILEQENVFTMLCGLEPRIATFISKYIYDIVSRDKRVLQYRRTIDNVYKHTDLISNVQGCILNCIEEVQACQTRIQSNFYLGDILVTGTSLCDKFCSSVEKQYLSPDSVISFRIDPYQVEKNIERVWKYLQKCQHIEAMHIDYSRSSKIDDEDIKSICDVIERNNSTLKALSIVLPPCFMKPIQKTIVRRLPDMSNLVAVKMKNFLLPHEDFTALCTFLSGNNHLEQISILNTRCGDSTDSMLRMHWKQDEEDLSEYQQLEYITDNETSTDSETDSETSLSWDCRKQYEVDLSEHQQLQYLKYDESVTVTRVNTSNLEIFEYLSLNNTNYVEVFDNFSTAYTLTEVHLRYDIIGSDKNRSYHTVTDNLITLLPLLHQLCKITLSNFTFTGNIMKFPSEMKSMKIINLIEVRMSLTTWRQFVDSLPLMPLSVKVRVWNMCITRDGEECNPGIAWWKGGGGEEAAARQYVRQQEALFNVEYENAYQFFFQRRSSIHQHKSLLL
ncbi:uncharacterized protein LOC123522960 isoform X2 [Mercenaria mercenaria]|uniref:uncharacterized protein LOC123522960 isoform X2 n=1 Tax=Mercenaria mercenaria TaxID=6596 RepID=UPI00234EBCA1|nr:uncharacterized protein LOC123522960 isoform X2 [Mercenaria mercenaria]